MQNIKRRGASFVAAGALALCVTGVADAGIANEYTGNVKGNQESYVGLDVNKREDGKRVVQNFQFSGPTTCRESGGFTSGTMIGRLVVKKGGVFEGERAATTGTDPNGENSTFKVTGEIVSKDVVKGSLRLVEVRRDGPVTYDRCNTGVLDFRVTKQMRVE